MPDVIVYTTDMCPYCYRAKRLLEQKGVAFTEIDVSLDPAKRAEMAQKSGGVRTVPQIFIGGKHVGGSDELYALEAEGKLDPMLAA